MQASMKRRVPTTVPPAGDSPSDATTTTTPSGLVERQCIPVPPRTGFHHQIHPLYDDPALHTLTPRSFAKSVAELDALRFRVQELEQKLSQHDVETLLPSSTTSTTGAPGTPGKAPKNKLPPLHTLDGAVAGSVDNRTSGVAALPPESGSHRKPIAPPLVMLLPPPTAVTTTATTTVAASPLKKFLTPVVSGAGSNSEQQPAQEIPLSPPATATSTAVAVVISTSSPNREQAKISIEQDGGTRFTTSQRQRLYQILKHVSTLVTVKEDDLVLLKKLVDAEIGDVIAFLLSIETESDTTKLNEQLTYFLTHGSPAKQHQQQQQPHDHHQHEQRKPHASFRLELPRTHPVWSMQYPLQKIARNLEHLRASSSTASPSPSVSSDGKMEAIVLVSSGAYNPIHMLHIRAFYVARQFVESNYKFPVVGAFISPSHDTFVRVKNRRNPHEMITKRHRLGLLEAAVASSSWIEVDKWEITRRRVLDYLSTLTHIREMCESHFPQVNFHLVYVCGCNTVVKLSHSALRGEGFGCITVCRPTQTEMVAKHLGKTLAKSTTIVEDTGVLPHELERATSFRARQAMGALAAAAHPGGASHTTGDKQLASLEMMVGKPVLQYMLKHSIPQKVTGREPWNDEDKSWRQEDLAYVEYMEG